MNIDIRDPKVDPEKLWDSFCVYFYNQIDRPFCQSFKELDVGFSWSWQGMMSDICDWVGLKRSPWLAGKYVSGWSDVEDVRVLAETWQKLKYFDRVKTNYDGKWHDDVIFKRVNILHIKNSLAL